jgi:hypothetical protein
MLPCNAAKYPDLSLLEEGRAQLIRYLRYDKTAEGEPESERLAAKAATLFASLQKLHSAYLSHPKNDYRVLANLGYDIAPVRVRLPEQMLTICLICNLATRTISSPRSGRA